MKNSAFTILPGLALFLEHAVQAQKAVAADPFKRLAFMNTQLEAALVQKDVRKLLIYYDAQAVCMPGYHQTPAYKRINLTVFSALTGFGNR